MLALSIGMSVNEFPYTNLLERSVACTKKMFPRQDSEQLQQSLRTAQLNSGSVSTQIEWKPEHFPHKMYDLLEDVERKGLDDIVSWLPDGKSFKIHSQIGFEQSIMPLYFSGMSSYKSFRRQLNLYGIYQHRHRPNQDANAYSHDLLIRGQRRLCDKIARKKTNPPSKSKSTSSSSKNGMNNEKNSSTNKKRNRSALIAAIDQRNIRSISESIATPSTTTSGNMDMMRRNMLMKTIYDDELSTRPNPVDVANIGKVNNNNANFNRTIDNNILHSFMGQYWEDLPQNMSSAQVVDEIIATFQHK